MESSEPKVGYTTFPHEVWGWYEFATGMILGAYIPLMSRSRNYDCESRHISWGLSLIDYALYFDQKFDVYNFFNWIMFVLKIGRDIFMTAELIVNCKAQLDWSTFFSWSKYFKKNAAADGNDFSSFLMVADGAKGETESKEDWLYELFLDVDPHAPVIENELNGAHPIVGAAAAATAAIPAYIQPVNAARLVIQVLDMAYEIVNVLRLMSANYYYYYIGKSFARHVSMFFVLVDHIFQLNIIVPTAPWNRYRTNA